MKFLASILLSVAIISGITAQDIKVLVDAPSNVSVGQQFQVTWTVNSRSGQFEAPAFTDFYKLMGPSTSFSQSTRIINGRVTSEIQNSYSYYLQATREGTFTIDPATYRVKKNEFKSESVTITVVKQAGQTATGQNTTEGVQQQQETATAGDELFARILVNHKSVFVGEPVVATLKIYSRLDLSGIQELKYPEFRGFLKQDIETPQLRSLERENVGSRIYGTGVLQRFLIYPQKSGKLTIDPATLTLLIQQRTKSNDPFFGDFFSSFNTVPRAVATQPVEINVKPLPASKPEAFTGIVGNIKVKSNVDKDSLGINDALTYRVAISGNGNLMLASPPEININPDIEIYEPKSISNLNSGIGGTSGSRTFEYVLIPRHGGEFTIPALDLAYFDPSSGTFRTVSTSEHVINVTGTATGEAAGNVFDASGKEDIQYLGRDIRFIKSEKAVFRKSAADLIANISFIALYPVLFILFLIVLFLRREHIKRNADMNRVRNRKAVSVARKRLKNASSLMDEGEPAEFYAELLKAIWGYLSDKLTIETSDLSLESSKALLNKKGLDNEIISRLEKVIGTCEFSQYSPGGNREIIRETYDEVSSIIRNIERLK